MFAQYGCICVGCGCVYDWGGGGGGGGGDTIYGCHYTALGNVKS